MTNAGRCTERSKAYNNTEKHARETRAEKRTRRETHTPCRARTPRHRATRSKRARRPSRAGPGQQRIEEPAERRGAAPDLLLRVPAKVGVVPFCEKNARGKLRDAVPSGVPGGPPGEPPPPSPSRTEWTRLVHPSVLTRHVSSLYR